MKLIRGLGHLETFAGGAAVAIGNFDGVHLGHRKVVSQLQAMAGDLPLVLVTFEPTPQEYFQEEASLPPRLTRLREKVLALEDTAVDYCLVLEFNEALAALSPQDFFQQVLAKGLNARCLLVGEDFRFGHKRVGNIATLRALSEGAGITLKTIHDVSHAGRRISSSWVREALAAGDLQLAAKLLGRPYGLAGRIVQGQQRGRTIGVPTANIQMHRKKCPLSGVFTVEMHGVSGASLRGVANVGTRPTVDGTTALLEVHLLDFEGDLYGKYVEVTFLEKLRDEKKFADFEMLKAQIYRDIETAREQWQTIKTH